MSNIEIDQDSLVSAVTFLEQFLSSKLPAYDFSPGTANRDIAINSIALVFAFIRQDVSAIKNSLTLFDLKDKTDESSNELVDAILSDYFITRHTGDVASGPVTLYFSTNLIGTVTIRNTDVFIKNNVEYVIGSEILFITSADLQKNTDNLGNTYYSYSMTLQAKEKGPAGRAVTGLFSSWDVNSPFLYKVEVLEDFGNGEGIETSGDLIKRSEKALTVKNLVTDNAIFTVLMAQFSFLKNVVSIGMHDPEMLRDLLTYTSGNTEYQIHRGSMIDIYCKFPIAFRTSVAKTAATHTINGIVKTAILMDNVPIYKVHSVVDTNNNNVNIPFEIQVEDIALFLSGRQKFYLVMSEDYLGAELQVTYDYTTNYQEVQDYVEAKSERTVVADSLVKAQFPMYLSFDMPVYSHVDIDPAAIASTLQDLVHSGEVEGQLYVATLIDKVTDDYGVTVQLPFLVTGKILLPNGKIMTIEFRDRIRTPERYMIDDAGNYLPLFEGETNENNYSVGSMHDLQISDTTTRYVLDKQDIVIRRAE